VGELPDVPPHPNTEYAGVEGLRATDGGKLWRWRSDLLTDRSTHSYGAGMSVVNLAVTHGVLSVTTVDGIYGIRATDGQQLWRALASDDVISLAVSD
jgi:hypothetical protein